VNSDSAARRSGHGPDDMGDDEQESEVAGYEHYLEDPPDDLVITEDDDTGEDAEETSPREDPGE
jgi:hypothetical protein